MSTAIEIEKRIKNDDGFVSLNRLYPGNPDPKERYLKILESHIGLFGESGEILFFSAPGRTEIGGNHTDHNHGRVLAAAIDLDVIAAVSKTDDKYIRVKSEGFEMDCVDTDRLEPVPSEVNSSAALIRGIAARFKQLGYNIGPFNAYTVSNVLKGSGLSSSAAFEVLIGSILNHLYNDGRISPVVIAQIAQYAENVFFGKPCGLMDQMASSVGGFVTIDFEDPDNPVIEKIDYDFASGDYALCIIDTKGDHADLTDEYAAVRLEMQSVAEAFGKKYLRELDEEEFFENINTVRGKVSDRAILRAIHFFADNRRVLAEVDALKSSRFDEFINLVIESGYSSFMYNQNIFSPKSYNEQGVSLALAVCSKILKGKGGWRVHGGGFAGTVQAFLPKEMIAAFTAKMESIFGRGCCYILNIRSQGGIRVF